MRQRPDEKPVRDASASRLAAEQDTIRCQNELVEAEREQTRRPGDEEGRRRERDDLASELALAEWRERPSELQQAIQQLRLTAAEFHSALEKWRDRLRQRQDAQATQTAAEARRTDVQTDAATAEARNRDARVHHETLREVHGAEAQSILAELATAKSALEVAAKHKSTAERELLDATAKDATARSEAQATQLPAQVAEAERDDQLGAVHSLLTTGLLAVLEIAPPELPLSTTRTVELARALEERLNATDRQDAAWSRVQDGPHAGLEILRRSLIEQRLDPSLHSVDELYVVEVLAGDRTLRMPELSAHLNDEFLLREATLMAQERTVIENHLIGDLATELHDLIHKGETLVRDMSKEVERRATSTGMKLRFAWSLRLDVPGRLDEARRRLMRCGATWSQDDKDIIATFLKGRLDEVRAQAPDAPWQEHIERAFD
jgi:hypothetical protein